MVSQKRDAAIVGTYEYPKRKAPGVTPLQIKAECAARALEDAGLSWKDVDGLYLGKLSPTGAWSPSFDCTPVQAEQVVAVGRDPFGSLVAHGHRTGDCGICNRRLSDPESVARGIGPVCAAKYGWL